MKTVASLSIAALVCFMLQILSASAFTALPPQAAGSMMRTRAVVTTSTTQLYFFGQPKDDGSPGDYVCKDCGYVFTQGPAAWAKLPDNYSCPPCGAPKRRFTKVPKGSASGKVAVKKSK